MNSAAIDVVGIGNAIVDVIAHADEPFIAAQGFPKGSMNLIDAARA
ncbi:MAG: adenosine kinase, partial [Alphaproteobacteria bacterium]|nr:adenosine kinase [Alphaproteobacteria bacterium]